MIAALDDLVKILFLDIDGVMVTQKSLRRAISGSRPWAPDAVAQLNRVLSMTDAKIVVSSAWRYRRTVEQLDELLVEEGMPKGSVIGKTAEGTKLPDSDLWCEPRGTEIQRWLDAHPEVQRYAIVDDSFDAGEGHPSEAFIQTSWEGGLTSDAADRIIRRLKGVTW